MKSKSHNYFEKLFKLFLWAVVALFFILAIAGCKKAIGECNIIYFNVQIGVTVEDGQEIFVHDTVHEYCPAQEALLIGTGAINDPSDIISCECKFY